MVYIICVYNIYVYVYIYICGVYAKRKEEAEGWNLSREDLVGVLAFEFRVGFVGFPQLATTLHDSPGEGPEGIEAASGLIRLRERQRERERVFRSGSVVSVTLKVDCLPRAAPEV